MTTRRRSKYGNVRTTIDGVTYDSKREAHNHLKLAAMQRAGVIRNLKHHVRFPLVVAGEKVCDYIADHVYEEQASLGGNRCWVEVVADTKSPATRRNPTYRLKRKLFHALTRRTIVEL